VRPSVAYFGLTALLQGWWGQCCVHPSRSRWTTG